MKLSDFQFRIVKPKNKQGNYKTCDNAECKCNHPFIYGKEALFRLGEFIDTDARIELWSGFYDSEGRKIYEGDIVKTIFAKRGIVKFKDGGFYVFDEIYADTYLLYTEFARGRVTIIGNIHENAELLNCEQRG